MLEVPAGEGFAVSDLVDAATERPIRHGAQIAELVQLRVLLRMSAAGRARSHAGLEHARAPAARIRVATCARSPRAGERR